MSLFWPRRAAGPAPASEARATWWPRQAHFMGGGEGYASVNVSSPEAATQAVAVGSSIDLIASLGSELPFRVLRGQRRAREEVKTPGYLDDPDGSGQGNQDWRYQVLWSWLTRGNMYGEILAALSSGVPTQVRVAHPDEVSVADGRDGGPNWAIQGEPIPRERFMHRRVFPVPGRLLGLSPIAQHAREIGLALTTSQFGLQWFRDGAHPGSMLLNTEVELKPGAAEIAKQRFMAAMRGSREPVVLGKGWEWKPITVSPEESQFLQTRGYSAAECARIYGPGVAEILGYESGGSMTYANVESRAAHLLIFAVNKWLARMERLLTSMLPAPQYVVIDRAAVLQSTTLERYRAYAIALDKKFRTVNEVRDDEDDPPVSWGDQPNENSTPAQPDTEGTGAEAPTPKGTP